MPKVASCATVHAGPRLLDEKAIAAGVRWHGKCRKVTAVETGLGLHALTSVPRPRAGSERFDLGSKAKGQITTMFVFPFTYVLRGVAMQMLRKLWKDQDGFVVSTELVLVATILVIGMVVGLATVRNAVVQELGDVALAIGNINQSYQYGGVAGRAFSSETAGSFFDDSFDFCDNGGVDPSAAEPAGMSVQIAPINEDTVLAKPGGQPAAQ
jgi:hypothetical protein